MLLCVGQGGKEDRACQCPNPAMVHGDRFLVEKCGEVDLGRYQACICTLIHPCPYDVEEARGGKADSIVRTNSLDFYPSCCERDRNLVFSPSQT